MKFKFPANEHSSTPESSFSANRKSQNDKNIYELANWLLPCLYFGH